MRLFGLIVASTLSAVPAVAQQQQDCALAIRTHGFFSRSQARCGFARYSRETQNAARTCSRRLSSTVGQEYQRAGADAFDRNERERGHDRLCGELLERFPDIVGR